MLPFQKTTIYQETLNTLNEVLQQYTRNHNPHLSNKLQEEAFTITTNLAKAFNNLKEEENPHFKKSIESIVGMIALMDLDQEEKTTISPVRRELTDKLYNLQLDISKFKTKQKKILILSAKVGQGHMTAAHSVADAIHNKYGYDYDVEIVDFMELLSSIINVVTKTYYENSVKFAPSMYKFLFESSDRNSQIVKILNQVNYPFVLTKIKKFFEEKQPDLLISTFPIWNYLAAEIWKKYNKDAKFISIITDSITIHSSWTLADTDYHIVANDDTKAVIEKMGVKSEKIKTLGFPIPLKFLEKNEKKNILSTLDLDPKKQTILFLPTSQGPRKNQRITKEILGYSENQNLIIITGRDSKNKPRLEKLTEGRSNVRVIGWTDKMPEFIQAADIVVTKAGGATIQECIAAQKPMVITSVIPGQEQGNAQLIKRYHLGIVAAARDNIAEHIDFINKNRAMFERNLKKNSNPQASLEIAEFIHDLLEKEL